MADKSNESWHLDKRIPIAIIMTIALQTTGAIWFAATAWARINSAEQWISENKPIVQQLPVIQNDISYIKAGLQRIEVKIDRSRRGPEGEQ